MTEMERLERLLYEIADIAENGTDSERAALLDAMQRISGKGIVWERANSGKGQTVSGSLPKSCPGTGTM